MPTRRATLVAAATIFAGCSGSNSGGTENETALETASGTTAGRDTPVAGTEGTTPNRATATPANGSATETVETTGTTGIVETTGTTGTTGIVETTALESMALSTPAFDAGATIPTRYTCDGTGISPPLAIGSVPETATTLALVVDDPDAPNGTFVHWLLWNVPADTNRIPSDVPRTETVAALGGAQQGTNSSGEIGYRAVCPPEGDEPHTYRFTLFALDRRLELDAGARRDALENALAGSRVARTRITATYGR